MTTTTADLEQARKFLDEAREAYETFQDAMRGLGYIVRDLDEWQYQRVDAYPGWTGSRDVGGGTDMMGWLDEIASFLDDQTRVWPTTTTPADPYAPLLQCCGGEYNHRASCANA